MTFIGYSLAIIDQRGEIAKEKLGSFLTDAIVDEAAEILKNKIRKLLIIEPVRLN